VLGAGRHLVLRRRAVGHRGLRRRAVGRPAIRTSLDGADADGGGAHHLGAAVQQGGADDLDAAAAAHQGGADLQRRDRDLAEDLEGDAHDLDVAAAVEALDRPAEQRRGRAGVLRVGIPGSPGQLGRHEPGAVRQEERVAHARIDYADPPGG
jgi:hypothetical protein